MRGNHCWILLQVSFKLVLEVDPSVVKETRILLQTSTEHALSLLVVDNGSGCVIDEYFNDGNIDKAFNVFEEIREKGIACSIMTYNLVINE
ncbi:unnamed protein product [Vicia faba]|uniref:Pentatricopeptide repeat-containing protein n=1 Tax=Vicia faba TaxID=3906 RepID=A0AAV0ZL27_VICFA|nr:unnamed protein product [Vicia faba]